MRSPSLLILLLFCLATFGAHAQGRRSSDEDMTAEKVINNYIKAIGGKGRLGKLTQLTTKFIFTMGELHGNGIAYQKTPNKYHSKLSIDGKVVQEQVFNGKRLHVTDGENAARISGAQYDCYEYRSYLFPELHLKQMKAQIELSGEAKVDSFDAYKVVITLPSGVSINEYYHVESFFKLRSEFKTYYEDKEAIETVDIKSYTRARGTMMPLVKTVVIADKRVILEATSFNPRTEIPNKAFRFDLDEFNELKKPASKRQNLAWVKVKRVLDVRQWFKEKLVVIADDKEEKKKEKEEKKKKKK